MCNSILAHIHPHLSKSRLLFETNEGINEQCLQLVPYMPGTTVHNVPLLVYGAVHKAYRRVLSDALLEWYHKVGSQHSPRSPGGPQVEPEDLVAPNVTVSTNIY